MERKAAGSARGAPPLERFRGSNHELAWPLERLRERLVDSRRPDSRDLDGESISVVGGRTGRLKANRPARRSVCLPYQPAPQPRGRRCAAHMGGTGGAGHGPGIPGLVQPLRVDDGGRPARRLVAGPRARRPRTRTPRPRNGARHGAPHQLRGATRQQRRRRDAGPHFRQPLLSPKASSSAFGESS
jgi:hypothetical protein